MKFSTEQNFQISFYIKPLRATAYALLGNIKTFMNSILRSPWVVFLCLRGNWWLLSIPPSGAISWKTFMKNVSKYYRKNLWWNGVTACTFSLAKNYITIIFLKVLQNFFKELFWVYWKSVTLKSRIHLFHKIFDIHIRFWCAIIYLKGTKHCQLYIFQCYCEIIKFSVKTFSNLLKTAGCPRLQHLHFFPFL